MQGMQIIPPGSSYPLSSSASLRRVPVCPVSPSHFPSSSSSPLCGRSLFLAVPVVPVVPSCPPFYCPCPAVVPSYPSSSCRPSSEQLLAAALEGFFVGLPVVVLGALCRPSCCRCLVVWPGVPRPLSCCGVVPSLVGCSSPPSSWLSAVGRRAVPRPHVVVLLASFFSSQSFCAVSPLLSRCPRCSPFVSRPRWVCIGVGWVSGGRWRVVAAPIRIQIN